MPTHCSCGNRFDGDNFCMESACEREGLDEGLDMIDAVTILNRWEAVIKLLYPEEMTPTAQRVMSGIIATERKRMS